MATYCSAQDVADFLGVTTFSSSTTPTKTQVESFIEMNEDYIDNETMHTWREKTVTDEYHHIDKLTYNRREGIVIWLNHRKIRTFSSSDGDKLEVWDGSDWTDYLTDKTEGRNNDFWVDYNDGVIFLNTILSSYLPRYFDLRVTYRFGETSVKGDIKKACILLTARDVLMQDDRSILLPEGTSNISLLNKAEQWKIKADEIIFSNKEIKLLSF